MDTDIYTISENYQLQPLKTVTDESSQITFVKVIQNFLFDGRKSYLFCFQAITHKNLALVAFAFANGLVTIYGKTIKYPLTFFHSIKMETCNDIDFFEEDSELFMAIASAARGICVFKWIGAHFDQIYQLSNLNAVGVSSFHTEEGRVVVVLAKNQPSVAFTFKNNTLHKIQNLKTLAPSEVISYEIEGNIHTVILDGSLYNTYLYNGVEFLHIKSSKCLKIEKIYLNPHNNHPTLFATKNTKITIYQPTLTGETFHNITIDLHKNHTNITTIIPIFQNQDYALLILTPINATLLPFSVHINTTLGGQQSDEEADDLLFCLKTLGGFLEGTTKTKSKYTRAANSESAIVGVAAFGKAQQRLQGLQSYFLELKESAEETQLKINEFIENVSEF